MQIKKDEVKAAILEEAEKEFLDKGFDAVSVRKLAKAAGTTIGNFYNYFDSKEALFEELVAGEYRSFMLFIESHNNNELPDYLWESLDAPAQHKLLSELLQKMLPSFSDRFLLLIECSKGTKYEGARKLLLDLLKEHFIEHIRQQKNTTVDEALAEIIAEQVLLGFILILKKYKKEETRRKLLTEHLLYHFIGAMGLFEWS